MRAYTELLVRTCHRRGAHAIGGMAAFIPSRRDAEANARALEKVREDKRRESGAGFDGTWVAHPDLVPVATEIFDGLLGDRPHQKDVLRLDVATTAAQLGEVRVPGGTITRAGVVANIDVALRYLDAWLRGSGAVAIHNLMEDTATAEISRAQLWQWRRHRAPLADGGAVTEALYREERDRAVSALRAEAERSGAGSRLDEAAALLDALVLDDEFTDFLTIPGYAHLA
jgi:malate synthase